MARGGRDGATRGACERLLTPADVRRLLQSEVNRAGTLRQLGGQWGVAFGYISDVIRGVKAPGRALLDRLGLEPAPHYRRRRQGNGP